MNKYNEIKILFEKQQDSARALKMAKYMKNKFIFYGIDAKTRKNTYHEFLKQERLNKEVDWQFLNQCYEDEHREFQYLVGDYLQMMKKYLCYEDIEKMGRYLKNKQWWDTIDIFDGIIGQIGLNDLRVAKLMKKWSVDDDFWLRRIAINHQLGRKEKTDPDLLEVIICNNFNSKEFFINKAIGWSLRDYSKTNPKWVKNFINKYQDKMANLSIKEASKYI